MIEMLMIGYAYLDTLVMEIKARSNSVMESFSRFSGGVYVPYVLALHETVLVIKRRLNYTVSDCFSHYVFRGFLALKIQFQADIPQRDSSV